MLERISLLQDYPYCKFHLWSWKYVSRKRDFQNPGYMKKDFYIIVESIHLQDSGDSENALDAPKEVLKKREVVTLDIYQDDVLNKKMVIIVFVDILSSHCLGYQSRY